MKTSFQPLIGMSYCSTAWPKLRVSDKSVKAFLSTFFPYWKNWRRPENRVCTVHIDGLAACNKVLSYWNSVLEPRKLYAVHFGVVVQYHISNRSGVYSICRNSTVHIWPFILHEFYYDQLHRPKNKRIYAKNWIVI